MGTTRATPRKTARPRAGKRKPKADTEAILGNSIGNSKVPAKWQAHYRRLVKMRDEINAERRRLVDQARELKHRAHGDNIADAGTDTYDQDFALGIASSEQQALFEIEGALNRVKTGRYGICEATGKRIDRARLEAIPWTRFSAEAERDLEASNAVDRARIGERGDLIGSTESLDDEDAETSET
jgi:RNA polymerase-binding transcription factor DksA